MKQFIACVFSTLSWLTIAQAPAKVDVIVTNYQRQPIAGDKISFIAKQSKQVIEKITDSKGRFQVSLPQGETYDIRIEVIGDELDYNTMEIPVIPAGAVFQDMEVQIMYEIPEVVSLSNLHFKTGSAEIESASLKELDQLAAYLKRKPTLKIEVGGHTDNQGDDVQNQLLSEKRAFAVKKYLINNGGIPASRILAKGYGESKPIASNDSATGRARNRRTEIKMVN